MNYVNPNMPFWPYYTLILGIPCPFPPNSIMLTGLHHKEGIILKINLYTNCIPLDLQLNPKISLRYTDYSNNAVPLHEKTLQSNNSSFI